nr:hypothetical protein [uncultured Neisseria sp.]
MKKFISLLLLLPALSAHAEISLIKKMTHAECMQVIRDSLDMYNDMEFCEKNTNEETQRNGMLAWTMAGFANSKSEMSPICPTVKKMTKQEQTEMFSRYPKSHEPKEVAKFCTSENRKRIAKLYPTYSKLFKEYDDFNKSKNKEENE